MVNPKALIEKWMALPPHKQGATLIVVPLLAYFVYCSTIVIVQPVIDTILETHHDS